MTRYISENIKAQFPKGKRHILALKDIRFHVTSCDIIDRQNRLVIINKSVRVIKEPKQRKSK